MGLKNYEFWIMNNELRIINNIKELKGITNNAWIDGNAQRIVNNRGPITQLSPSISGQISLKVYLLSYYRMIILKFAHGVIIIINIFIAGSWYR